MTTLTATRTSQLQWPAQVLAGLVIAAKFTVHFVVALLTVLLLGADHADY